MTSLSIQTGSPEGYEFEAVILSGEKITGHWLGDFVVELSSIKQYKPRLAVDYNHNDENIIGYGENVTLTPEGLKATGKLASGTYADEIVKLSMMGVPFEASVDIDLENADAESILGEETIEINGRSISGPCTVYKNVPLFGFAICPHGADKFTNFVLLKMERDFMKTKKTMVTLADASSDVPPADVKPSVKDPVLAELIDIFGMEKGIELWQADTDIEEVRQWKALNEKYSLPQTASADQVQMADVQPPDDPAVSASDAPPANDAPKKDEKLSADMSQVAKLTKLVESLLSDMVKLKSAMPRGAEPVSHQTEQTGKVKRPLNSLSADAAKMKLPR